MPEAIGIVRGDRYRIVAGAEIAHESERSDEEIARGNGPGVDFFQLGISAVHIEADAGADHDSDHRRGNVLVVAETSANRHWFTAAKYGRRRSRLVEQVDAFQ